MFRCEECGQTTKPGEGCNRVVAETRPKVYYAADKNGSVEVGRGQETVRERNLCRACFQVYTAQKEIQP